MNNKPSSFGVLEYVNLALAVFSWLFSDIEFYIKAVITIVLLIIVLLSNLRINSWLRNLSLKPITILFGFPIVSSIAMYQVASLCYSEELLDLLINSNPLSLSLVYGLLVGLPIVLLSATLSKYNFIGINLGFFSSFLWFFSVFEIVNLGKGFNIWQISIFGPIGYAFIGGDKCGREYSENLLMIIITLIGVFLIPSLFYYFGKIWRRQQLSSNL
jgi:hypothetical protein